MGIMYTSIDLNKLPDVTAARVLVGSANNRLAAVDVTGDMTIGNTGVTAIGASKVLGSMIPDDAVGYFETATEVEVDHADASPKQLLASDALNDRLIMVQAIASETATGGPDFDVGSVTGPNAAFDDIGAGVWVAGERWTGFCLLPATEALRCTIADAGTAGKIKFRSVVLIPKVETAQVADAAITAVKWAQGAGVAAVITAGLGASAAYTKATNGVQTLVALDAAKARSTIIVAIVTEAFANDGGTQTKFKIGETATDDKYAAEAVFTNAALNAVKVLAGPNTINNAIIVTATAAVGAGTGAISVVALVLPAA